MQSAIVQKVTGKTVLDYLKPRLFDPLGFKDPTWEVSPQGINTGGFGLRLRTAEIARFGQLYLQKGKWDGKQLIPAAWVKEATSLQTSNGSNPKSDWDQGYGYQFWRARHNAYRGDGAFGQYCLVIPDLGAVVAITGGVREMQRPLNLIWDRLLPALKDKPLPEDADAQRNLKARLAALTLRLPKGRPTSPLAAKVSGKRFAFPKNDRGIESVSFDFDAKSPTLVVRTADAEVKTPVGMGSWAKSSSGFANGLDRFLSVPKNPLVAATGAWTSDDAFTVKLALYQTPFTSTLKFHFDRGTLVLDAEHNVAFGRTKLPQLTGRAEGRR
jgi:hypothetical protein